MGFRYQLTTSDGEIFGEAEYSHQPNVGDELIISGNRRVRVLAYVPTERISEFVDRPVYGVLEVEPIERSRSAHGDTRQSSDHCTEVFPTPSYNHCRWPQ